MKFKPRNQTHSEKSLPHVPKEARNPTLIPFKAKELKKLGVYAAASGNCVLVQAIKNELLRRNSQSSLGAYYGLRVALMRTVQQNTSTLATTVLDPRGDCAIRNAVFFSWMPRKLDTKHPLCQCGCEETTKGGRYLPGHDAKHKSALVAAALGGSKRATTKLEQLGWKKFLDAKLAKKAEVVPSKPAPVAQVPTTESPSPSFDQ
jgi:hypothetical protein